MKSIVKKFLSVACLASLAACSSNVVMDNDAGTPVYKYAGQIYRSVVIKPSAELAQDADKMTRLQELALDKAIVNRMIAERIYDDKAVDTIEVTVNSFRFRNDFNAVMWGFMAGSDNIDGDVTLKDQDGKTIAHFNVTASYALGGFGGGPGGTRMGWMAGKFAEQAVNTIMNKTSDNQKSASAQ